MLDVKRSLGQYSTPIQTVDYMVKLVLSFLQGTDNVSFLDPSVGDGIFVERLIANGIAPRCIHAMDIDETVIQNFNLPTKAIHQDFLTSSGNQYDVIIGNPPYKSKRESDYIRENRARLETQFEATGIQNMYSMFMAHALKNVKEGGLVCFIVQDSFLTNVYYSNFRKFILDTCIIREITLAPRRLFHHTNADVRTAIILLEKCTGEEDALKRSSNVMRLVDRLTGESEYCAPPESKVQRIEQKYFGQMERFNFFINVPKQIVEIVNTTSQQLGDVVMGGTGISTGKDALFLKNVADLTDDEENDWVPFYKNGGSKDAWYYETPVRIHKDWETPSKLRTDFMTRNTKFYFREGITCSSMGVEFSAAYLPPGCLFGVNANFFTNSREDLFYILALLNSCFARYVIRSIFNRTNMVTAGYVKRLPYVEPPAHIKSRVVQLAANIVDSLRANQRYDYEVEHEEIEKLIFEVYGLEEQSISHIKWFCSNIFESL